MQIAIVGAGIGGLTTAALLARMGHKISIYEKFDTPRPLGAGLLLQPTGLTVLASLGLEAQAIAAGSRINRLYGRCAGKQHTTLDVRYADLDPELFGIGIHRASLFALLYQAAVQAGCTIITDTEITAVENGVHLCDQHDQSHGPFDLIIDSSGMRSRLRGQYPQIVARDHEYKYGALWATVTLPEHSFRLDTLEQRYHQAARMVGILPTGSLAPGHQHAAFFWSMRQCDYAQWRARSLEDWKNDVVTVWPETALVLDQFQTHDDLAFAGYRDVVLRQFYQGRVVFTGDAAHCTSPQLGQGANLALVDAAMLAQSLCDHLAPDQALPVWQKARQSHIRFYQWASRWLTPFFQSDSMLCAKLRFLTCDVMCHIPPARKIAARVLTGTMTGPFSAFDPQTLCGHITGSKLPL